jgi:hypothetical protein
MALSPRPKPWRVRVRRVIETWIEVSAHSATEAEGLAANYPQVVSVFVGSTIRADLKDAEPRDIGVEDE